MSGFIRNITVKRTFENDAVTLVLRPLGRGDELKFMDLATSTSTPVTRAAAGVDIMKSYVEKVDGLTDAAGSSISVDELFTAAYFNEFLAGVFAEWLGQGHPRDPSPPAATSSAGSAGSP